MVCRKGYIWYSHTCGMSCGFRPTSPIESFNSLSHTFLSCMVSFTLFIYNQPPSNLSIYTFITTQLLPFFSLTFMYILFLIFPSLFSLIFSRFYHYYHIHLFIFKSYSYANFFIQLGMFTLKFPVWKILHTTSIYCVTC